MPAVPAPNRLLRAARERAPSRRVPGAHMSRDELAEAVALWAADHDGKRRGVAFDANHLGKLERGIVRCPRQLYVNALCAVLNATPADLGFAARSTATRPLLAEPRAVIDLFDGAPVGADYVESLHATIKHLVALDGLHGGADVAPLALRSFRRAQCILGEGRYETASERDLEAVTAEIGELSGWLLFDAARHEESRQVNAEALTLARIAGDASMEWFVLSNQALASVHTGRNREALRIAQGMTWGQDPPGRVRALFDVRAARALAALGDSGSALRVFDRARSAFADGTTMRDPAWSWWFDERELAGHEGMIHAALGDHSRAIPHLAAAVERSEHREHFRWALYIHRANLLRALLRAGSWAEAERVAIDVAPMVGMIASVRTEGLLRRTVAHPGERPQMPSTLSDTLDYIDNRLAQSQ